MDRGGGNDVNRERCEHRMAQKSPGAVRRPGLFCHRVGLSDADEAAARGEHVISRDDGVTEVPRVLL